MLTLPIKMSDIRKGIITDSELQETRDILTSQGKGMKYEFEYEPHKVYGVGFRCVICSDYFFWHQGRKRGSQKKGETVHDVRNQCRSCYPYYFHGRKSDSTQSEKQIQLAKELIGGNFWSYVIIFYDENGALCLYFGATSNIISRAVQHAVNSSNPKVANFMKGYRQWFEQRKDLFIDYLYNQKSQAPPFSLLGMIPFGHEAELEAYQDELNRWEHWSERDGVVICNKIKPSGAPPRKNVV